MSKVIDPPDHFFPRVVHDADEIDRLRRFQMRRYFESGLVDTPPTELPLDPLLDRSAYFGIYSGDEIQATARLVQSSTGHLPLLDHHEIYPHVQQRLEANAGSVAELSGLAVHRHAPHFDVLAMLSRECFRYGLRQPEATLVIASIERPLVRLLSGLLEVPLHVIGPKIKQYGHYNGATVPILIDTIECLETYSAGNSPAARFYVEGLTIDLTEQSTVPQRLDDRERVPS